MNPIQRSQSPRGGNENVRSDRPTKSPEDDKYKKVERDKRSGKDSSDQIEEGGEENKTLSPFELAKKGGPSKRRDSDSQSGSGSNSSGDKEGLAKMKMGTQPKATKNIGADSAEEEAVALASAKGPSNQMRSIPENQKGMMDVDSSGDIDPEADQAMKELSSTYSKQSASDPSAKGKVTAAAEQAGNVQVETPKPQEPVKTRRATDETSGSDKDARGVGGGDKIENTKTSKREEGKGDESGGKQNAPFGMIQPQLNPTGVDQTQVKETTRATPLQEIITQIVDKVTVMQKGDLTETTITLKNPPILAGASITLSTLDQAKGEFNITFASLSPEGKLFLDRQMSENSLTEALKGKNITVHQIITTTQVQNVVQAEQGQPTKEDQQQREQQQQQQQREQENQEEE